MRTKSIQSIISGHDLSDYVKAACSDTRNVSIIKEYLEQPANRANHTEHLKALCAAISHDDYEIAALILSYANLSTAETSIEPFKDINLHAVSYPAGVIVGNALRYAGSQIVRLLLKQPQVCQYLQALDRDDYMFTLLDNFFLSDRVDARTKCELVAIAANNQIAKLPKTLLQRSPLFRNDLDKNRRAILFGTQTAWGFKQLTAAVHKGVRYQTKEVCKTLPGLPVSLINKIYDMAIGEEDLLEHAFSKQQLLRKTLKV